MVHSVGTSGTAAYVFFFGFFWTCLVPLAVINTAKSLYCKLVLKARVQRNLPRQIKQTVN